MLHPSWLQLRLKIKPLPLPQWRHQAFSIIDNNTGVDLLLLFPRPLYFSTCLFCTWFTVMFIAPLYISSPTCVMPLNHSPSIVHENVSSFVPLLSIKYCRPCTIYEYWSSLVPLLFLRHCSPCTVHEYCSSLAPPLSLRYCIPCNVPNISAPNIYTSVALFSQGDNTTSGGVLLFLVFSPFLVKLIPTVFSWTQLCQFLPKLDNHSFKIKPLQSTS